MAEEKKPKSKPTPAKAAALLQEAADALTGIGGKNAAIWQAIAVRVNACRASVEKYK
jgi:hypothetical protein